jgi:hypothetical protein
LVIHNHPCVRQIWMTQESPLCDPTPEMEPGAPASNLHRSMMVHHHAKIIADEVLGPLPLHVRDPTKGGRPRSLDEDETLAPY